MLVNTDSIKIYKLPNSFFESIQIKKTLNSHHLKVSLSTRDYYSFKTSKAGWFKNELSNNIFVKVACIYDEALFNSINKDNYIDHLELSKNNHVDLFHMNIKDYLGEKRFITDQIQERSDYKNLESFYKFFYNFDISARKSNFIGLISYCFFDGTEIFKNISLNLVDPKRDNTNYIIDKFVLLSEGNINKKIKRVTTTDNELWYSNYSINTKKEPFFTNKKGTVSLKYAEEDISVIDNSKFTVEQIEKSSRENFYIPSRKINIPNNSFIGNVEFAINNQGNLNTYFPIDIMSIVISDSICYNAISKKIFDPNALSWIKELSDIREIYVERQNLHTKEIQRITPVVLGTTHLVDSNIENKSLSKLKLVSFEDEELKHQTPSSYSYYLNLTVEDGYKEYLDITVNKCTEQLEILKEYLNFCETKILEKVEGKHKYYNFITNQFLSDFIDMMNHEDSFWKKCINVSEVYTFLYNFVEKNQLLASKDDLDFALNPKFSSIESIRMFYEAFSILQNKLLRISKLQKSNLFTRRILLISNFKSYNGACYYQYFDNTHIKNFDEFKKSSTTNGSFYTPTKIVKFNSSPGVDEIEHVDLKEDERSFMISDEALSLIVQELKKNHNFYETTESLLPYQLMSEYLSHIMYTPTNTLAVNSIESFRNQLLRLDLRRIMNLYNEFAKNSTFFKNFPSVKGYADEIIQIVNSRVAFLKDYLGRNISYLHQDYRSLMLFSILFGKSVRVEYLDGFLINNTNNLIMLKQPNWKLLELNVGKINEIISRGSKIYLRLVPINLQNCFFFNDNRTDLSIFNRYFTLG